MILMQAVKLGVSDIHLEPFEQELRVRYRVDGVLRAEPVPERLKNLESAINTQQFRVILAYQF